jgi:hypothetical protein
VTPSPFLGRPGWDALLLAALLLARLRINTLAEAGLFEHFQNVTSHSLLGRILSDQAEAAFGPWFGDPIALLLAALSLAALLIYLVVDLAAADRAGQQRPASAPVGQDAAGSVGDWEPSRRDRPERMRVKTTLVWLIIALTVLLPTLKLALLRHENLPHSYRPRRPSTSCSADATPMSRTIAPPPWPTGACLSSAPRWTTTPTCHGPSSSPRQSGY